MSAARIESSPCHLSEYDYTTLPGKRLRMKFVLIALVFAAVGTAQAPTECDNGGSSSICSCDDGKCYKIGADPDCNLPVGLQTACPA
ncbi:hypothetical protein P8C59_009053 [Phyllachora maydis]|uniref:Uncharacterized protein n=1 Tax=Phyllachora maydis TaxID=1825666 RepID=A0AAD9MJ90_9PEZI|nr:hypothetical protein P8C59_009053 [Phyllachora maydis]